MSFSLLPISTTGPNAHSPPNEPARQELPLDLFRSCISFLDPKDQATLKIVCKSGNSLMKSELEQEIANLSIPLEKDGLTLDPHSEAYQDLTAGS